MKKYLSALVASVTALFTTTAMAVVPPEFTTATASLEADAVSMASVFIAVTGAVVIVWVAIKYIKKGANKST